MASKIMYGGWAAELSTQLMTSRRLSEKFRQLLVTRMQCYKIVRLTSMCLLVDVRVYNGYMAKHVDKTQPAILLG